MLKTTLASLFLCEWPNFFLAATHTKPSLTLFLAYNGCGQWRWGRREQLHGHRTVPTATVQLFRDNGQGWTCPAASEAFGEPHSSQLLNGGLFLGHEQLVSEPCACSLARSLLSRITPVFGNRNLQAAICSYLDVEAPNTLPVMALVSDPDASETENIEPNTQ